MLAMIVEVSKYDNGDFVEDPIIVEESKVADMLAEGECRIQEEGRTRLMYREAKEFEVADDWFVEKRDKWMDDRAAVLEAAGNPDFFTLLVSWDKAAQDCVFSVRC